MNVAQAVRASAASCACWTAAVNALVIVKVVVRRLKCDRGIEFEKRLPDRLGLFNVSDVHGIDALFGFRERGSKYWIGSEGGTRPFGAIGRLQKARLLPRDPKCERGREMGAAQTAVILKALPHAVRAADIEVRRTFGEQVDAAHWYGAWKRVKANWLHRGEGAELRRELAEMGCEGGVHLERPPLAAAQRWLLLRTLHKMRSRSGRYNSVAVRSKLRFVEAAAMPAAQDA